MVFDSMGPPHDRFGILSSSSATPVIGPKGHSHLGHSPIDGRRIGTLFWDICKHIAIRTKPLARRPEEHAGRACRTIERVALVAEKGLLCDHTCAAQKFSAALQSATLSIVVSKSGTISPSIFVMQTVEDRFRA
jgi:hypothetical protein